MDEKRATQVAKAKTVGVLAAMSILLASCASAGASADSVATREEVAVEEEFMASVMPRDAVEVEEEEFGPQADENVVLQDNPIGADSPPSPEGAPNVHVIVENGNVYLRGTLPDEEMAEALLPMNGEFDDMGTVMNEFSIDSSVEVDSSEPAPIFINDTVLFDVGSAQINEVAYPLLAPSLALLENEPTAILKIVGHTDSVGDEAFNLALSQARVEAVREWMIASGAEPTRLTSIGMGETEPRADNETEDGRAQNRRVEFIVDGMG